jgi:hypothetical protein
MGKEFSHVDIPQCSDVGEVAVTARRTCIIRQSDLLCLISLFVCSVFLCCYFDFRRRKYQEADENCINTIIIMCNVLYIFLNFTVEYYELG